MKTAERAEALEAFSKGDKKIISCVKALNAGVDVPECSLAIATSGNSTQLAAIQRTGRISRFVEDKIAIYVNLYVKHTQERKWLIKRTENQSDVYWVESIDSIKV